MDDLVQAVVDEVLRRQGQRPALHERFVPAAVKMACTDCVCSGGHCAAVGGFAALRMRRPLYGE